MRSSCIHAFYYLINPRVSMPISQHWPIIEHLNSAQMDLWMNEWTMVPWSMHHCSKQIHPMVEGMVLKHFVCVFLTFVILAHMGLFIIYLLSTFRHPSRMELVQSFPSWSPYPKLLKVLPPFKFSIGEGPLCKVRREPRAQPKVQMLCQQSLPKVKQPRSTSFVWMRSTENHSSMFLIIETPMLKGDCTKPPYVICFMGDITLGELWKYEGMWWETRVEIHACTARHN